MEVDGGDGAPKRRVHGLLQLYYGLSVDGKAEQSESADPCDINGPHFDPELFLNKVNTPAVPHSFTLSLFFTHRTPEEPGGFTLIDVNVSHGGARLAMTSALT